MRIAVAGATGNIGGLTVSALEDAGHDVARIGRSLGVDLTTGVGLDRALTGVDAVIDTTNSTVVDAEASIRHFAAMTGNLLAAEHRAGVRHHVLLSIAGVDQSPGMRTTQGSASRNAWSPAARSPGPSCRRRSSTTSPRWWPAGPRRTAWRAVPARCQPVAPSDVAGVLAEVAAGPPRQRYVDVAGPAPQDMVEHGAAHVRSTRLRGDAAAHVVRGVRSSDGR